MSTREIDILNRRIKQIGDVLEYLASGGSPDDMGLWDAIREIRMGTTTPEMLAALDSSRAEET